MSIQYFGFNYALIYESVNLDKAEMVGLIISAFFL